MGWCSDERPACEGFIVAMVPSELPTDRAGDCALDLYSSSDPLRELSYPERGAVERIRVVRVGCACGWRSHHLHVPALAKAEWFPHICAMDTAYEERAKVLWLQHLQDSLDASLLTRFIAPGLRSVPP
jgi:hypothetical protein